MSMKVDYSTPLTQEEREYLEARGAHADIERADSMNGVETPEPGQGDGTGLQMQPLLTSEARAAEKERLLARLRQIEGDEADADLADDDEDLPPYEEWSLDLLKTEIDTRNEGREHNKMSKTGSQATLAARLRQDDEEQPVSQEPATPTV
jgi:hypothetical protein